MKQLILMMMMLTLTLSATTYTNECKDCIDKVSAYKDVMKNTPENKVKLERFKKQLTAKCGCVMKCETNTTKGNK